MAWTAEAWAAFSIRHGVAATSIRYVRSDTEHWIKKEAEAGVKDWQLVLIAIRLIQESQP